MATGAGSEIADEKRQRIIRAALREFADRGYELASTNTITGTAGISKGLLFHYFGSKEGLYLAVIRHCIDHSTAWTAKIREREEPSADLLGRLLQSGVRKLRYTIANPMETKVIMDAFLSPPDGLKDKIEALGESYRPMVAEYFTEALDTSLFRKGVNVSKAMDVVMIFLDGLRTRYARPDLLNPETFNALFPEIKEYFEILKYGIYEREP